MIRITSINYYFCYNVFIFGKDKTTETKLNTTWRTWMIKRRHLASWCGANMMT